MRQKTSFFDFELGTIFFIKDGEWTAPYIIKVEYLGYRKETPSSKYETLIKTNTKDDKEMDLMMTFDKENEYNRHSILLEFKLLNTYYGQHFNTQYIHFSPENTNNIIIRLDDFYKDNLKIYEMDKNDIKDNDDYIQIITMILNFELTLSHTAPILQQLNNLLTELNENIIMKESDNTNTLCPICFDPIRKKQKICWCINNHGFHSKCYHSTMNKACPICRDTKMSSGRCNETAEDIRRKNPNAKLGGLSKKNKSKKNKSKKNKSKKANLKRQKY